MNNTLLHTIDHVEFGAYKPEDAKEAIDHSIQLAQNRIKKLYRIKESDATFENTVLGLTRSDEELEFVTGIICHLETMRTSEWEKAKDYAIEQYTTFGLGIQFDSKIYSKLIAVKNSNVSLDQYQLRLLDKLIQDYEDNGINLPKDTQNQLKKLVKKSVKLCTQFKPNILKAREAHPLLFTSEAALKGVRKEQIAEYKKLAEESGKSGYLVTTDDGNFDVIMTSCSVKATRKKMHKAFTSCVSKKNNKLLFDVLQLRHQMAQILGYETPGHMLMRNRMVQDPQQALKFITELISHYSAKAKQEYADLLKFVQSTESKSITALEQYDFDSGLNLYYPAKYFESLYNLNIEKTKEYFEFNAVRDYMFDTLSTLYSVRFETATNTSWHEDVEVYNIYDANDTQIAQVHCDWFSRKDKHGHAWMNEFVVADREVSVIKPHVGCVIMNISPATSKTPALMSIDTVETMWHEFGHFMHLAFSNTHLKEQSMMACKWDFVEAPSQIMENWVLHEDVLPKYAKHYKTGEPLSRDIVETVKKMSLYNVGIKAMRQLYFAYVDLMIHSGIIFSTPDEMADYARKIREETLPVKTMSYFATLSTFGHIVGGYASGYYTYKWSESIQADLFTRFEKEGVLNPEVGEAYKTQVLARGDEVDPDQLVRDFLGRDSLPSAMLKRDQVI